MRRIAALATCALALVLAAPAHAEVFNASVSGSGTITDDKGQMSCPGDCQGSYGAEQVTFTATPAAGWQFQSWSGLCAQFTTNTCTVNGQFGGDFGAVFVEASTPPPPPQEIAQVRVLLDDGLGRVTSTPGGIDCVALPSGNLGGACVASFAVGTEVTLTPAGALGYAPLTWGSALAQTAGASKCLEAGATSCTFRVTRGDNTALHIFGESPVSRGQLHVSVRGGGLVDQNGVADLQCPLLCRFDVRAANTRFTLVPRVFPSQVFDRWEGYCRGRENAAGACVVTAGASEANRTTAVFRQRGTFSFETPRGGRILIRTRDRGSQYFACPPACSSVIPDEGYSARPDADPGFVFVEWAPRGYCWNLMATTSCAVSEWPGDHRSRAVFRPVAGEGQIRVAVQGPGRVSKIFDGRETERICPGACIDDVATRREIQREAYYIAVPNDGGRFVRWEGCDAVWEIYSDARVRSCYLESVASNTPRSRLIRAVFADPPSVRYSISGQGTLFFDNNRNPCSANCTQLVPNPGSITARPQPRAGWYFSHWGAACEGSGERCTLRDLPERVSAQAVFRQFGQIRVRIEGAGTVRPVTGPRGEPTERFLDGDIWCSAANQPCVLPLLDPGRYRALRVAAEPGWHFKWFEGYCSSLIRPVPRECHVDGGNHRLTTTAVFERD